MNILIQSVSACNCYKEDILLRNVTYELKDTEFK